MFLLLYLLFISDLTKYDGQPSLDYNLRLILDFQKRKYAAMFLLSISNSAINPILYAFLSRYEIAIYVLQATLLLSYYLNYIYRLFANENFRWLI